MSAITGIYHPVGEHVVSSIVSRMTGALAHRGPDGIDTWQAGPVGLGHCMLRTTPEAFHENLPFTCADGTLTITADARIDNRGKLISDLNLEGRGEVIPDSSLIMYAYQRWGESCLDHLLGDFAFAIWDAHKHHLFCARDHMGVKPFYYYSSDELFAFASEIKALFNVPGIPREVNEKTLAFRLAEIDPDPAVTSYLDIRRLPAAHAMTVSPSGLRIYPYWSLDPRHEIHFETDEEYENAFRTLFTDAVRCRMRSPPPLGSELSGGLDSSSVVCVARHLMRQENRDHQALPLHTFSAVFDEVPECDERTYINYVLAGGDLTPHFIYPEQKSLLFNMEDRIRHVEEPSLHPNSSTYATLYQTARDSGVRVVLSGEWGDVIVSYGTGALRDFVVSGKILRAIREIIGLSKKFHIKKRKIIWSNILVPFLPHNLRHRDNENPTPWIREDFAHRTGLTDYYVRLRKTESSLKTSREHHFFDLMSIPISLGLETTDKIAAVHSIEPRYPFLDRRIVEFCLALPPEQRIRKGFTRAIEREAMAPFLPPEIRRRTSKVLTNPYIRYSLVTFEGIRLKNYLFGHPDVLGSYINLDLIHESYRTLMAGRGGDLVSLWYSLVLSFWLHEENRIEFNTRNT